MSELDILLMKLKTNANMVGWSAGSLLIRPEYEKKQEGAILEIKALFQKLENEVDSLEKALVYEPY